MTISLKDIDYSSLSPAERLMLAQELWVSAYEAAQGIPLSDDQRRELDRRMAAADSGQMPLLTWDQIKARLAHRK